MSIKLQPAILKNDRTAVETLVNDGIDINMVCRDETALTFAIKNQKEEIALWLVAQPQCDITACNRHCRTPLFCAANCGNVALVEILLQKGANVDEEDFYGDTPLAASAWHDHANVAEMLISAGADINKRNKKGETPLLKACSDTSVNVANLLLQHGADVNIPSVTSDGKTSMSPLMASVPSYYKKEVKGKKLSTMMDIMKNVLQHGAIVDAVDERGNTALHIAVETNEIHAVFLLIENNCDTSISNNKGLTPLGIALQPENSFYQIAFLLLLFAYPENDPLLDTNDLNKTWVNLLLKAKDKSRACHAERQMLFRILTEETGLQVSKLNDLIQEENNKTRNNNNNVDGLMPNKVNNNSCIQNYVCSEAPLSLQKLCRRRIRRCIGRDFLSKFNQLELSWSLKRFLVYGLDMRKCHPVKACEMQVAVKEGDIDKLNDVISSGIDVNMSLFVKPPISIAAENGKEKCAEVLLQHGAKTSILDMNGDTPLHLASKYGHSKVLELLISNSDDINVRNSAGNTPLHEACSHGMLNAARLILDHGGNPSIRDKDGMFPIHFAAASGDVTLLESLLDKNASNDVIDKFGNTPLHLACSKGLLYLKDNISLQALFNSEIVMNLNIFKVMYANDFSVCNTYREHVNHIGCIDLLLTYSCDMETRNDNQKTAFEIAEEFGLRDITEHLGEHKIEVA